MKKFTIIALVALMGLMSTYKVSEAQFISVILSLTGNVLDMETNEPLSMRLEAFDSKGNRIYYGRTKAENKGYYFITGLKPGAKYTLKLSDNENYKERVEEVNLPNAKSYEEIQKNLLVEDKIEEVALPGK